MQFICRGNANYSAHDSAANTVALNIMKDKGGNNFKLPHLHKDDRENEGRLPIALSCDTQLVADTMALIKRHSVL